MQSRFAKKARIQSNEDLAKALSMCSNKFRIESEKKTDLDNEISWSKLPDHIHLLVGYLLDWLLPLADQTTS